MKARRSSKFLVGASVVVALAGSVQPRVSHAQSTATEPERAAPSVPSNESPVAVTTRVTPDPSHIADRLVLEVTVAYPAGYTVNLPTGVDFKPLHRVDVQALEPEPTGQGLRRVFRIVLQHFDVGQATVPAFSFTYVDPAGQVKTQTVHPSTFQVDALLANEANPARKGDDPPRSLPYPNQRAEWIIVGSILALLAAAAGALTYWRWRNRVKPEIIVPARPAHEVALEALDGLQARAAPMIESEQHVLYYLELTEILKGYLQRRFAVEALDRTTDELRRDLVRAAKSLAPLNPTEVIAFLQECDLVKFARVKPTPSAALAALVQTRNMVEISKPVVVAVEPATAKALANQQGTPQ